MLVDSHGRNINYVRLAVTDRCNLRCFYCMPEEGIDYVARQELLTYEEMVRVINIMTDLGIEKLRITGGEPFLRKDLMDFIRQVVRSPLKEIHITTNGTLTKEFIPELKDLGIKSINLSLDSLDRERFKTITRRDELHKVLDTLDSLLTHEIPTKINMVVMEGRNTEDIIPMANLAAEKSVDVRYIEEMPFNGTGAENSGATWDFRKIYGVLQSEYPDIRKEEVLPGATSTKYSVPGFQGSLGIIAAYSRTFCGTCNRIRVTPKGMIRTCLYDQGVFNIRDLMRQNASDKQIGDAIADAVRHKAVDGFAAEKQRGSFPISESMSTIGG